MAINPKKHVVPHKHIIGDIVDGVTSNFTGGLIGGGAGGGGGYSGGLLNIVSDHKSLKNMELIDYVWSFYSGAWLPHTKPMPMGTNHLKLSDDKTGHSTEMFLVMIDESPENKPDDWVFERYSPILGVSTGMIVKKDITCGGYVGANQGLVALGSGMRNSFDPPGAWLLHSQCKKINFMGSSAPPNPREGWRWMDTGSEPVTTLGSFKMYQIYERQGNSWVKVGASTFDNGYEFGVSKPNWGKDNEKQYFITVGGSTHGHIHYFDEKHSWTDKGDIDDPAYSGFFDTFEIRRAAYSSPLQPDMYAHLRCANITAHNTNPAADLTYGLGTPDRRWLGICADTIYADKIKDLKGDDFNFGNTWNGGTVTENITIKRADPQLHLNAASGTTSNA